MPLTQVNLGLIDVPQSYGFRNRIINGDMRIDQRNNGASVTPTSGQYTLDRWASWQSTVSKYSVQQNAGSVTPPAGFSNYLGVTSLSAYSVTSSDTFFQYQPIEGFNFADMAWGTANAQTVTLSFWVRSSLTGTFGGAFTNNAANRSYPFTYTISAANTWEYKTITIPGDTTGTWLANNGIGAIVRLGLGSGSTFSGTAGAWAAGNIVQPTGTVSVVGTNGATFYITGVQLEAGTTATPFERVEMGESLRRCQRYLPAYLGSGAVASGICYSASATGFTVKLPVTPRVAPTGIAISTIGDFAVRLSNGGTSTLTGLNISGAGGSEAVQIEGSGSSGLAAGNATMLQGANANAKLFFTGVEL